VPAPNRDAHQDLKVTGAVAVRGGWCRPGRVRRSARPLGSMASGITTKSSQKGPPIALKRAISAD
jgi:hypothetical protein